MLLCPAVCSRSAFGSRDGSREGAPVEVSAKAGVLLVRIDPLDELTQWRQLHTKNRQCAQVQMGQIMIAGVAL
jgi:hypothetical protein